MRLEELSFLLTAEGRQRLAETTAADPGPQNHLRLAGQLGRQVGSQRAHAILETVLLRQRAVAKFSRAAEMVFTRQALEQASSEVVARYRAGRFVRAQLDRVLELGCGIGGDSLALCAQAEVLGVDGDTVRLAMARENVRVYGHGRKFQPVQADLRQWEPWAVPALFADPGRRDERGRRLYSVERYRPPLSRLLRWRPFVAGMGIKISPGVSYDELPDGVEVEFISLGGQLRECALWFGRLRTPAGRRATLLPGEHTLTDEPCPPITVARPEAYLYEPDSAVIRAHLVEQLANRLGATKIDPDIAYLTASRPAPTPFARLYRLEDAFPFQLKRLRSYLRHRNVGHVVLKKRGSPLDLQLLERQLRLRGDQERIVFLTRAEGRPAVLVGRPYEGKE